MTEKEKSHYLSFLTAKLGKLVACADPAVKAALAGPHAAALVYLAGQARLDLEEIKQADAELELMSRGVIGRKALDRVIAELTRQFGFGRVADDPDLVIQRIIQRGEIAGKGELRVVLGALSYVGDDGIGPAEREAIERIAREYEGWD